MDPVIGSALIQAGGQVASGLLGNIGAVKRQKRIIKAQTNAQKELMDYQHEISLGDWERQNAYDEQLRADNYANYDSLQAQVKDAKAAGLNPEVVAGGASSGSSSASGQSIGGTTIPSAPDVGPAPASVGEIIGPALERLTSLTNTIDDIRYNRESKQMQLEAQRQKLEENKLNLLSAADKLDWSREDRDSIKKMLSFNLDAVDLSNRRTRQSISLDKEAQELRIREFNHRVGLDNNKESREKAIHALQQAIMWEDLTEKNWKNWYRKEFGKSPDKGDSLASVLMDLVFAATGELTQDTETSLPRWQNWVNHVATFLQAKNGVKQPFIPFEGRDNFSARLTRGLRDRFPQLSTDKYNRGYNPYWPR